MNKRVLVLMSTYNGAKYLQEQIESVMKQKNIDVYILVRDDGSKDGTQKILQDYSEQGKLKWMQGTNKGSTKSFMELIYLASTEYDYYAFCDQDDVWMDDKLNAAVVSLEKFPKNQPALYYSGQRLVDQELNFLADHHLDKRRSQLTCLIFGNIAGCTAVFNKELLIKLQAYKCNRIWIHDGWIYKVCVALGGNIFVDSNAHIFYRQHEKNEVGLNNSFKSIYNRSKKNIFEASVVREMKLIEEGYGRELSPEYKAFAQKIMGYDSSPVNWLKVMFMKEVNFFNWGLQMNYIVKVFLKKL